MFMIDGMNEQALGVVDQLLNGQNLQGFKQVMSVGLEWAFRDGSDYFFLDFEQLVNIFLRGTAIDGQAVDKVGVHH